MKCFLIFQYCMSLSVYQFINVNLKTSLVETFSKLTKFPMTLAAFSTPIILRATQRTTSHLQKLLIL